MAHMNQVNDTITSVESNAKIKLVIVVENGQVADVYSDIPGLTVEVRDYDFVINPYVASHIDSKGRDLTEHTKYVYPLAELRSITEIEVKA